MKPIVRVRAAVLGALVLVLGVALKTVVARERILDQGRIVLVALTPVDPRSLMQGDYMRLRFAIDLELAESGHEASSPPAAYAHLALDAQDRASLIGVSAALPSAVTSAVAVGIRPRGGQVTIGAHAFFFQGGRARAYESARWGEFRVAPDGTALLTHLRDGELKRLGEQRR